MKTIKAYEQSDIDLKNNQTHRALADALALAFSFYIRSLDRIAVTTKIPTEAEIDQLFSGTVASFLTILSDRYEIVDSEKRDAITSVENLFGFPSGGWHESKDPEN